ncbi:Hypothetical protein BC94_0104 [Mycoplasmopsis bovis]|uniref:Uncharacterized protein n=1 Tax=Mycoplasmopsis bovis TaxID=28903 RepID=A0A8D4D5W7_MYCBV|nr:Hypothetical protein BC85_0104 [Mycoplasmopsis bovis]AMW25453.1 Hypothetical protein BC94_0104 [Mycoplasmopsis bovis]AMW26084.1 Hypothetical protein BC93_0104 [Mycoplasmopsis bovis]
MPCFSNKLFNGLIASITASYAFFSLILSLINCFLFFKYLIKNNPRERPSKIAPNIGETITLTKSLVLYDLSFMCGNICSHKTSPNQTNSKIEMTKKAINKPRKDLVAFCVLLFLIALFSYFLAKDLHSSLEIPDCATALSKYSFAFSINISFSGK